MSEHGEVTILRGAPYFPVADVAALGNHYESVFGFQCEYSAGDPAEFAVYSRSGCPVMLRRVSAEHRIMPNETQGGTWDAFFWVTGVDSLFAEMTRNGADIVYAPAMQPYGMKEFAVRDPAGYVLGFGESQSLD